MRLEGKRVLVTGASSGLGRQLALGLAKKAATVAISGRSIERLQETALAIKHHAGTEALVIPCDVVRESAVKQAVENLGGVDVLINNAGWGVYGAFEQMAIADFDQVFQVNFYGSLYFIQAVLPFMRRQHAGLIVNVCSAAAIHGVPYLSAYGASKAALASVAQALRAELVGTGVNLVNVYPSYVQTPFFEHEKHVGGGVRPQGPFIPANKAATRIIKGMEKGKREIYFPFESWALRLVSGLMPSVVEWVMTRISCNLREG